MKQFEEFLVENDRLEQHILAEDMLEYIGEVDVDSDDMSLDEAIEIMDLGLAFGLDQYGIDFMEEVEKRMLAD